jgi:alanine racemase
MGRALKAIIDSDALKHNLQQVRTIAPDSRVIAMVKADGYGHGLTTVANALKDADAFGVACIEEALKLREAGVRNRIILMEGFFQASELSEIINLHLEPVIHHEGQIKALQSWNTSASQPLKIWIKINTGMHRLGFSPLQFKSNFEKIQTLKNIETQGFLTHFSNADELDNLFTLEQIHIFTDLVKGLKGDKSLSNSAGILGWPQAAADWVRPGIMLYGVSPFPDKLGKQLGLLPAMTLTSELIAIQSLEKGDAVGYGGRFICPEDMSVGVVAVGYADGYPRLAPNGTPLLVNGKLVPLVGRVSMDMLTVDLRTQPDAKVGDRVQLWGTDLPVEQVASAIGTLAYELLTGLSTRVPLEIS